MLTVHHLNNSRSQRVLWLLEELGVPYEIKHYQRNAKTMLAPPELLAVHPLGKSPVITDGGNTVAESGAIIEYIVEKYGNGRLAPMDEAGRLRYRYWMHYAEGTLMPLMVMSLLFSSVERRSPMLIRPLAKAIAGQVRRAYLLPNTDNNLNFLEKELQQGDWLLGSELTAADVQLSFAVQAAALRGGGDFAGRYPRLDAYIKRIEVRPAYQRALQKGGPFELLRG